MSNHHSVSDLSNPAAFASGMAHSPIRTRPAGVSATGVLSIISGLLGCLSSFAMGISLLFQDFFASMSQAQGQTGEQAKAIQEMNAATQAIAAHYKVFNGTIAVLTFLISIGLLVGGIGLLMSRPGARTLLRRSYIGAMINEILSAILYVMSQLEMAPVMAKYMGAVSGNGGNQATSGGAETIMQAMIYFGLMLWLIWSAVKIFLYALGYRYLHRPQVIDYLATSAS